MPQRDTPADELKAAFAVLESLTIMTDGGPETVALTAGMLIVVPQGRWPSTTTCRR